MYIPILDKYKLLNILTKLGFGCQKGNVVVVVVVHAAGNHSPGDCQLVQGKPLNQLVLLKL